MRRLLPLAAILALLVPAAAAGTAPTPKLVRVDATPLVLAGSGFAPGERVSVTLATGYGVRRARVIARNGRFRVEFRVPAEGCGAPWAARAVGSLGSRTAVRLGVPSPCIPPPSR